MDTFPENKVSDFVVQLPKEIDLSGSWEAGIAEIMYPNSFYNIETEQYYLRYMCGGVLCRTRLSPGYYENPQQIVKQLLHQLKKDLLQSLKTKETEFLFDLRYNIHTQLVEIEMKASEKRNIINFSQPLADMLGFSRTDFSDAGVYTSERIVDVNPVTAIFLYCDVIEHRTVGDILAPLIGVVPVEGPAGTYVAKRYDKIQYHPILKKNISTIHISLCDDQGQFIRFQKGKVIVTLHFRPQKLLHL